MNKKYVYLSSNTVCDNLMNLNQLTFEVTDACNLKCKYCGYGEFYEHYDERNSQNISIEKALKLLEYLEVKWNSRHSNSHNKPTYISFYGGEPLLNMPFIKDIVSWIENREILSCHFVFTMTTNAVLLDRYIDYLVEHKFEILISLDGDEYSHGYRVDHAGNNSFERVFNNIKLVQEKYPEYFVNRVNFNAVLHNRNDYSGLLDFFRKEFDKLPSVSELNPMGIKPDRIKEFSRMYNSRVKSLDQASDKEFLQQTLFMDNPETAKLCSFLHTHSGNVFKSYNDLLSDEKLKNWIPTGTCLPFEKKMFVTVNGKILPCERVSHEYALGYVDENEVVIDVEQIVEKYNGWYKKFIPQCSKCYNTNTCKQCMFYNNDLNDKACCDYFMNECDFNHYIKEQYKYLADHPDLYKKIMEEVVIR